MTAGFWNSQPVDRGESTGIIKHIKKVDSNPTPLPQNMSWGFISDINAIVDFLAINYVEDITSSYRLFYSKDFIEFLFKYPHHQPEYSLGLFNNGILIGYIMGREHEISLRFQNYKIISVNFLCLDKEYRNLGLAPLMIKEITRIANKHGLFEAIFTAEKDYGFSFAKADYYHLPINHNILEQVDLLCSNFNPTKLPIFRKETRFASSDDLKKIYEIYNQKYAFFILHEKFEEKDFLFNFTNRKDVIITLYNEEHNEFASFYIIKTKCITEDTEIKRAYLYYWSGSYMIISDAVHALKNVGVDMVDLMQTGNNQEIIDNLGFLEGTGILKYHFYNIKETFLNNKEIDFILF